MCDSRPMVAIGMRRPIFSLIFFLAIGLSTLAAAQDREWKVPAGGNTFRLAPDFKHRGLKRDGLLTWADSSEVFAIYFRVDRAAELQLGFVARVPRGLSQLRVAVADQEFQLERDNREFAEHGIGTVQVSEPCYVRVELQGLERSGDVFAEIRELIVRSTTSDLQLTCVSTNDGNMFYWGRRGPSVHLRYSVPRNVEIEYAYSEITVAPGDDPIGSYFMANGFAEGYFGIQVNSELERRVLFSVWSPFKTDNPRDIPEDQRVTLLARGPDVKTGEFGNEGSGGQSYLVYPWEAGKTYRFLTRVVPDGQGNTEYTSWFGDKSAGEWRLIASFRRPKTDTSLKGFHSFLENFDPTTGHLQRRGQHQNVWVRDTEGNWHECLSARFSVDATGGGGHRLDFTGGADGKSFFMRNCGFFSDTGKPGEMFERQSSAEERPQIDFDSLPMK